MATSNPAAEKDKGKGSAIVPHAFLRDDFPAIRTAVMLLVFSIMLGSGLVSATQYLLDQQLEAAEKARAEENSSHEKYRLADTERSEIKDFQPKYRLLAAQGFVGSERRLDWIERISAVQKQDGLEPITYEIGAQSAFAIDPQIDTGTLEVRGSSMHIKMNLLHELDLLRFLNGIQKEQVSVLQNCSIRRWPDPAPGELAPHFEAQCDLIWITMGTRGGDVGSDASLPILPGP